MNNYNSTDIIIKPDQDIFKEVVLPHNKTLNENIVNTINFIFNIKNILNKNIFYNIVSSSETTFSCIIILSISIIFLILLKNIL
jgi:hypothetical protein